MMKGSKVVLTLAVAMIALATLTCAAYRDPTKPPVVTSVVWDETAGQAVYTYRDSAEFSGNVIYNGNYLIPSGVDRNYPNADSRSGQSSSDTDATEGNTQASPKKIAAVYIPDNGVVANLTSAYVGESESSYGADSGENSSSENEISEPVVSDGGSTKDVTASNEQESDVALLTSREVDYSSRIIAGNSAMSESGVYTLGPDGPVKMPDVYYSSYSGYGFTEDEVYLLASMIETEAGGLGWYDKASVAEVATNRLTAGGWYGSTLSEVITKPNQFAYGKSPTQESLEVARSVLGNYSAGGGNQAVGSGVYNFHAATSYWGNVFY